MGNMVPEPARKITTTTTVRVEIDLFMLARRRGTNLSRLMNQALRAVLKPKEDEELSDAQIAQIVKDRSESQTKRIDMEITAGEEEREENLRALQSLWNEYLVAAPDATRSNRLEWIGERKLNFNGLKGLDSAALLKELQG